MVMMFLGNLLRALAFILYPMVFWDEGKAGKIPCLAIGFLFADGDTATDIANLLLAIHMALQVFLPSASPETAGLAPYTTTVFLFWIFFPVLMASLAFINGDNAFSNQGTGCVLPVRPFSYRLALAWIPRYIILTTITVITASVYVYVVYIGRNLGQELASLRRHGTAPWDVRLLEQTPEGEEMTGASSPSGEPLKPLPRLVLRGLIPSTSYDLHDDVKTPVIKPLNEGVKLTESELGPRVFSDRDERLQWQLQHSSKWGNLSASASPPNPFGPSELLVQSPQTLQEVSLDVRLVNSHGTFYINATEPCRSKDQPPLPQALAPGYLPSSCLPSSQLLTMVDDSAYDDLPRASHLRTHRQIRKQTRLLFIYPLVYLLTSIVPLIAHCFQYSDYYVEHPNFTLSCFAAAATSVQCALESMAANRGTPANVVVFAQTLDEMDHHTRPGSSPSNSRAKTTGERQR
ncbi:MAG: hypothetical protein M1838_002913 [Thelocarpon superellum]|nr:MAG: hypothetical protein M1838_002913 [Thelocarpon superellum]